MTQPVNVQTENGSIQGFCNSRFQPIANEFERNFRERGEVGASVCLISEGETLVDLWGGFVDRGRSAPWDRDTVCTVFSCTKGATAICAHMLASRGLLDIEAPVAQYWPEFATNGKEEATVRMMLDHSAGVPAFREPMKELGCTDWEYMVERLAAEEPWWKPGIRNGYHMLTFGWTVGELVRRVSGRSLGTFFQQEVAKPLGIDFWIGLPEEFEARVSPVINYTRRSSDAPSQFEMAIFNDNQSLQAKALLNNGGFDANSRACHAAEIGGGGGISNARGLAGLYAPLAAGGGGLVDATTLARMAEVSSATKEDATLLVGTRFALGFMKSIDNRRRAFGDRDSAILSSDAFGHVGAGGSIGFADPTAGFSFGYAMNQMGRGILLNDRGQSLVDAAYRCLGYTSNDSGVWAK